MGLLTFWQNWLDETPKVLESVVAANKLHRDKSITKGFVAGSFDLLHPGHLMMLRDAKKCL